MGSYLLVFLVAAGATALFLPGLARVAQRVGALDDTRSPPVPRIGGPALVLGSVASLGLVGVVFAPTTTLAELQEMLQANELVAVAGPSDAGIFTLALRASVTGHETRDAILARLRADPRVRFAEPLGPEAPAR